MNSTSLLLAILMSFSVHAQTKYLHCGHILDCIGLDPLPDRTIIVKGNTIVAIVEGYLREEDGAQIIDLKNHFVMPGIMDVHVHIESESGPNRYLDRFRENKADIALKASVYCKKTLMSGITTVRDLGGTGVNVSLRNAIEAGHIIGPRIYTAEKSIATTGGHADSTNGVRDDLKHDPGPKEGVVNILDDAYKAVRQRYKNGVDCIK